MAVASLALLLALAAPQAGDSVVVRAKEAIAPLTDSAALHKAGYRAIGFGRGVRDLTPFQGQHWVSTGRILGNLPVDLSKPTFMMYLPLGDSLVPIGVAYSQMIGVDQPLPDQLGGTPSEWHGHVFCLNVPGEGRSLADNAADCKDRGGAPAPMQVAMVHTWTIANPDGPYAQGN